MRKLNKVFRFVDGSLDDTDVRRWLSKAENCQYEEFIMEHAPIKPKAGEIFLYRCKGLEDKKFLADMYTGFGSNGNNLKFSSDFSRCYFAYRDRSKKTIPGFSKDVIWLRKYQDKPKKVVLIHYKGNLSGHNYVK